MAYNVSDLTAYVQENRDLLVKNFALVGGLKGTRSRITIQTGVKEAARIHPISLNPTLQDGAECSFNASGSAILSERLISTAPLKYNDQFCEKDLIGKFAEYLVAVNAVDNKFTFEEYITDLIIAGLNKKIEKLMWQGDASMQSSAAGYADLHWTDGFITIANGDSAVIDVTFSSGDTAYDKILAVYTALPEEVLEAGAEIYVSPATFRAFMQEMVTKNYFHYNPGNDEFGEFMLPGTDAKVVRTQGLAGASEILGTYPKNLVYGCDMENDAEKLDIWFSRDDRVTKVAAEWNSGMQIAFPDMVVLGQ